MKSEISQKLINRVTLIPFFLTLFLVAILSIFQFRLWKINQVIKHTDKIISEARRTQRLLLEMESNYNSYVITRRNEFLRSYMQARDLLPDTFRHLGDVLQSSSMDKFTELKDSFKNWVSHSESLFGKDFDEGVRIFKSPLFQHRGNMFMTRIRNEFDNFIASQVKLRDVQLKEAEEGQERLMIIGFLLTLATACFLAWYFRRQLGRAFQSYEDQTSRLQKSQSELQESIKEKDIALKSRDDFLKVASHELKTPLTSLKLQVQLLQRDLKKGEESVPADKLSVFLDKEDLQINRLKNLVEDMLDITRIANNRLVLTYEEMSMNEVIREAASRLKPALSMTGSTFILDLDHEVFGRWDRSRMEQIIFNLLGNAVKYGEGKPIRVRLQEVDDQVRLEVIDQGIGVQKESKERIFKKFERDISASEVSGMGLGLFITRELVHAHHGKVWVESEGEGRGATFIVEIPENAVDYADRPMKKAPAHQEVNVVH